MEKYFLSICLNPVIQKTIVLDSLREGEVLRTREYYTHASGKGVNVSRILYQLGENVIHFTHAGGRDRKYFLDLAGSCGLKVEWVNSFSEIRTCYTILNREKNTTTEIVEEAKPVKEGTEKRVFFRVKKLLELSHTLIISGSRAEGYSSRIFPEVVRQAKLMDLRVIIDYRGDDLTGSLKYRPDIIKPNLTEFITTFFPERASSTEEGTHVPEELIKMVSKKMKDLFREYRIITILTMGSHGVLYYTGERVKQIPAKSITPVNTIGCGDAFTAGLASALYRGKSLDEAVENGQEYASKNALQLAPGTIEPI